MCNSFKFLQWWIFSATAIAPSFSALFLANANYSKFGQPLKDSATVLVPAGPNPALLI